MATVYVKDNNVEKAIKQLRRQVAAEGTIQEYYSRRYYMSKGEERREKIKKAKRRQFRKEQREKKLY